MARKTSIDKLTAAITGILEEYADDVSGKVAQIGEEITKAGVKALRAKSRETFPNGTGAYARGWKEDMTKAHRAAEFSSTIYNAKHYRLAHLLEYGHVTRNGTGREFPRTPAHEHIAPVEQELVETFEKEVLAKL